MSLHFTFGAMNSGKSTLMLQTAFTYKSRNFGVVLVKPVDDTRDKEVSSRIGVSAKVDIFTTPDMNIRKELETMMGDKEYAVVLVDEAQFLTVEQVEELFTFCAYHDNIDVLCYGLKTNFKTKAFPASKRLMELADELHQLNNVLCHCGKPARINARFNSNTGKMLAAGPEKFIEGSSEIVIYDPICGKCFIRNGGKIAANHEGE